jgi:hypothetical protein
MTVGQNPAESRARPSSHPLSPPLPHGPAEKTRPSQSSVAQPARPRPRSVKRSQSRGSWPHDAAPGRARPANPDSDPNLTGVRSCLPRTPPHCPVSFLRMVTTKSKREKLSPMKPIMGFYPNMQQTRHKSSIQLEGISGTMLCPCWTLWPPEDAPTSVEDRPSHLCVANFRPSVSATVSEQNEFPTSLRFFRRRWHLKRTTIARDRRNSDELGQPIMEHRYSDRWRRRPLPNLICTIHHKPRG